MDKKYLTLEQVADLLEVNYQLIYRLVRSGELPAVKIGRVYRVAQGDLSRYLEEKRTSSGGVCAACGKAYAASSSLTETCTDCEAPICLDCWQRLGVRKCRACD